MKKTPIIYIVASLLLTAATIGCDEQYTTYSDKQYVMFAEQEQYFLVEENQEYVGIDVAMTVPSKRDLTFGVEVIDKGSNAIEGVHYRLLSNSVTIPAGKLAGEVRVQGIYENIEPADSLGFILKLIVPEEMEWNDLYTDATQTKVAMYKSCPYDINNYTGYCLVSSMLLRDYPGNNQSYQRIAKSELHPTKENTIILRNCFYDGYDVEISFHGEDPEKPIITMDEQTISDEGSVLGMFHGDDHILGATSPYYESYFNACQRFAVLWMHVYVEDMGEPIGTIGHFYNVIEWMSDEEAEDILAQM